MGNIQNTQRNKEERILEQPQQGEASEFYWACRDGDVGRVTQLLNSIPYDSFNRLELNGSTPLHAASYYGHSEVVRLLLHQRGCRREHLNRHGLTAYQEAQNDEIRQLFHRPVIKIDFLMEMNRAQSAEIEKYRLLVAELRNMLNPPAYVTIVQSVFGSVGPKDSEVLNRMIDEHVTQQHREYKKCKVGDKSS
ncbi:unnamed protein product [Didymodactylos carnosus]|uniref:Uncharacterized protein n=1 Tax=Didymodactylos carnosus TaxID=1234261 RepID=A0A814KCK1_9BILA|nr:unnamed protein product [Didymodactylos carnosus]CAF1587372.1 unnamed protein product [Didymodactylos carnosus]CAF3819339.1 unnamed protein product [Didymodactylos carnosus]CAF4389548.1 unnamed protein product [Didymodactylos carnosus]